MTRCVSRALLGLATVLLAGCTPLGQPAEEGDVAELRMVGAPPPRPPAPGDRLAWETAALDGTPGTVMDGLTRSYGLSFSQEPAGVYPGTRWYASTGSAVEPSDVTRDATVLVDRAGRPRAVTCVVAGPLGPDDGMLGRCAELAGLPVEVRRWVETESRRLSEDVVGRRRATGSAVVSVTTAGDWTARTQSVQITGPRL